MDKELKRLFYFGILLRLVLMPFFAYPEDIFETHNTSFLILENFKNFFHVRFSPLSHFIDSVFALLFSPFWPEGLQQVLKFQNYFYLPKIHRTLFLFKIPFLLFELAGIYLFYRFLKQQKIEQERIKKLVVFLLFNPITLYSIYIFGRFESYSLFLTFVILILLYRRGSLLKLVPIFALAPFIREFYFLVLFWLVLFSRLSFFKKFVLWLASYFPYAAWLFLTGNFSQATKSYVKGGFIAYLLEPRFEYSNGRYIYFYPFVLTFLLALLYLRSKEKISFSIAGFLSLAVFYAFSYFHPQYFAWILPFWAFILAFEKREGFERLYKLSWVLSVLFLSIPFPGAPTTFGVAFPLAGAFRFISIDKIFPDVKIYFELLRSAFRGLILSLSIYFALKR